MNESIRMTFHDTSLNFIRCCILCLYARITIECGIGSKLPERGGFGGGPPAGKNRLF